MLNALTIDLEEWFCVSNFEAVIDRADWDKLESRIEPSTHRILNLLQRHRIKATFFVLGWIAERQPSLIRSIAEQGHELASHGYAHRMTGTLSRQAFREDLTRSLKVLRELAGGDSCVGYRSPSFSARREMSWVWETLAESGIVYDSSVFPVAHDRYGEPGAPRFPYRLRTSRGEVLEFPPSTLRLLGRNLPVAGGGYLRLYPLFVSRWAIRRINREGYPAVVYIHPWEIDPDHPRPAASRFKLWRHFVGIRSLPAKLEALVAEFRFATMREVIRTIDAVPEERIT